MLKRRRSWTALVIVVVLAAGGIAAGAAALAGDKHSRASAAAAPADAAADALALPEPVDPAFSPPQPRLLDAGASVSTWAPVRRAAVARARPDAHSPAVADVPTETPEGTDNIVLVVGRNREASGRLWVQVRVPALPDNATGWVDRSALGGYTVVDTRLEVDLQRLTVTLYRAGHRVFEAPAGVGKPSWPTPKGHFYIRNKLTDFASPAYGPLAFGTSARSPVLTDWPGGGYIGIHGTDAPQLLPGRVSHGCIRLRNSDIRRLAELMPVGTPVTIT
jgi:lipoprotein-anchoring transpeptidase ErfK/SrfK